MIVQKDDCWILGWDMEDDPDPREMKQFLFDTAPLLVNNSSNYDVRLLVSFDDKLIAICPINISDEQLEEIYLADE